MYGQKTAVGRRMGDAEAIRLAIPAELATFVQRTYGMLAFSVILGAAACWAMMQIMPTREVIFDGAVRTVPNFPQWGIWALWGGTFMFSIMGSVVRTGARSGEASPLGLVALIGLVLCSGAMIAPTIGTYLGIGWAGVVASAGITTAVTFSALTAFVLISGKNFSFMRGFLFIAGFAFFIAWTVGIFFASSSTMWWMSAVGAILFCGYILYHTSAVVHEFGPANAVVPAVITLYLDIFNLFIMLLMLFSGNRRSE